MKLSESKTMDAQGILFDCFIFRRSLFKVLNCILINITD